MWTIESDATPSWARRYTILTERRRLYGTGYLNQLSKPGVSAVEHLLTDSKASSEMVYTILLASTLSISAIYSTVRERQSKACRCRYKGEPELRSLNQYEIVSTANIRLNVPTLTLKARK